MMALEQSLQGWCHGCIGLVSWVRWACRKGDRASEVRLRIESGDESVRASKWDNALLCAAGHNPYELVDSAVAAAARISGKSLAVPAASLSSYYCHLCGVHIFLALQIGSSTGVLVFEIQTDEPSKLLLFSQSATVCSCQLSQ